VQQRLVEDVGHLHGRDDEADHAAVHDHDGRDDDDCSDDDDRRGHDDDGGC
jgi:hypothetical protein